MNKERNIQGLRKAVSPWWLLIDSQSTINVQFKKELVKEISNARGRFIRFHRNSGTRITRKEETLPSFRNIWFGNRCIANILSLLKAKNKYRVIYYSEKGNQFIIIIPDKDILFKVNRNGIY